MDEHGELAKAFLILLNCRYCFAVVDQSGCEAKPPLPQLCSVLLPSNPVISQSDYMQQSWKCYLIAISRQVHSSEQSTPVRNYGGM